MAALEFAERDARAKAVDSQLGALHGGGGLVDFRPAIAAVIIVREGGDLVALGIVAGFGIDRLCKSCLGVDAVAGDLQEADVDYWAVCTNGHVHGKARIGVKYFGISGWRLSRVV